MSDLLEFQGISGHPNFGHFRRNGSFSRPTPGFVNNQVNGGSSVTTPRATGTGEA